MRKEVLHLVLIALLVSIVYSNIFQNEFVWDDNYYITGREETKSLGNIPSFFVNDQEGVYRPLRQAFYAISYNIWGHNKTGYHLNSLLIHIANSFLVYFLCLSIFKKKNTSLVAALIFSLHPVHIEAVTFMTSALDELGITFMLIALLLYIKEKKVFSALFALLAVFTYEITLVLPLLIIIYDYCFKKKIVVKRYVPYFVIAAFFVFIRFFLIKVVARADPLAGSYALNLATMPNIFLKYIYLLIVPINLSVQHQVFFAKSLFDAVFIVPLIALVALIYLTFRFRKKMIIFSVIWFFIALLPVSNVIPLQRMIAEVYLYLPSIGFALLAAYLIGKIKNKKIAFALVIIILLSYSFITFNRNSDWKDEETLWTKTMRTNPESSKVHANLGFVYYGKGDYNKAITEFETALSINAKNCKIHYNLGLAYAQIQQYDKAVNSLEKALGIDSEECKLAQVAIDAIKK